ncbi:transposase [Corynebacterium glutamicum]|nr:transposase [Corynebacterium glutamicum]
MEAEAPVEDLSAFIEQEKASFPITWMCTKLGVFRALYYRWAKPAGLTPTAIRHSELRAEVAQEFEKSNQMAGRDQLTTLLNQRGVKVSTGTVGSIMNE